MINRILSQYIVWEKIDVASQQYNSPPTHSLWIIPFSIREDALNTINKAIRSSDIIHSSRAIHINQAWDIHQYALYLRNIPNTNKGINTNLSYPPKILLEYEDFKDTKGNMILSSGGLLYPDICKVKDGFAILFGSNKIFVFNTAAGTLSEMPLGDFTHSDISYIRDRKGKFSYNSDAIIFERTVRGAKSPYNAFAGQDIWIAPYDKKLGFIHPPQEKKSTEIFPQTITRTSTLPPLYDSIEYLYGIGYQSCSFFEIPFWLGVSYQTGDFHLIPDEFQHSAILFFDSMAVGSTFHSPGGYSIPVLPETQSWLSNKPAFSKLSISSKNKILSGATGGPLAVGFDTKLQHFLPHPIQAPSNIRLQTFPSMIYPNPGPWDGTFGYIQYEPISVTKSSTIRGIYPRILQQKELSLFNSSSWWPLGVFGKKLREFIIQLANTVFSTIYPLAGSSVSNSIDIDAPIPNNEQSPFPTVSTGFLLGSRYSTVQHIYFAPEIPFDPSAQDPLRDIKKKYSGMIAPVAHDTFPLSLSQFPPETLEMERQNFPSILSLFEENLRVIPTESTLPKKPVRFIFEGLVAWQPEPLDNRDNIWSHTVANRLGQLEPSIMYGIAIFEFNSEEEEKVKLVSPPEPIHLKEMDKLAVSYWPSFELYANQASVPFLFSEVKQVLSSFSSVRTPRYIPKHDLTYMGKVLPSGQ